MNYDHILSLFGQNGGNVSISFGGRNTMHIGNGTCSIRVGRGKLDSNTKDLIHKYFLEHAAKLPKNAEILSIPDRLMETARLINNFSGQNSAKITEQLADQPEKQLTTANALHQLVLETLDARVSTVGSFELTEDGFNPNLDNAERNLMQVYEDLFDYFMHKEDYSNALKLTSKMKYSLNASTHCNQLALIFYGKGKYEQMFEAINEASSISDELVKSIAEIPSETLTNFSYEVTNKAAKGAIVKALLKQGKFDDVPSLISELDTDDKTQAYKEMINYHWTSYDIGSILSIIPNFYHIDDKTREYRRVIDYYWENNNIQDNNIPAIMSIITNFYHIDDKTQEYRRIIEHYWKKNNIQAVMSVIPNFYHIDDKTREYRRIIDHYWNNNNIQAILGVIPNFYHTDDKTREYRRIIEHHWKSNNIQAMLSVIPNFYHTDDKTREYSKILDYYLRMNVSDFRGVVNKYRDVLSRFYHNTDKQKYELKLNNKCLEKETAVEAKKPPEPKMPPQIPSAAVAPIAVHSEKPRQQIVEEKKVIMQKIIQVPPVEQVVDKKVLEEEEGDPFVCPITQEIMKDPVIDHEGNSYERVAIEKWLEKNSTSPVTRNPLTRAQLVPNRALKDLIAKSGRK